jgi:O-antigen ligase
MTLRRLAPQLAWFTAAIPVLIVAVLLQNLEFTILAAMGAVLVCWLAAAFLLGVNIRSTLLLSTLFFIKPHPFIYLGLVALLGLSLVFEYLQNRRLALTVPHPVALAVLFATALYGLARAREFNGASLYFISTAVLPLLLLVIAANSRITKADFLLWMKIIVVIGALLGVIGMVMALLNPAERYGSLWITAMTINGFYILTFFFALALGARAGMSGFRYFWFTCALFIFLGMLYTYTRMALLAIALGFFLLMLRMKRLRLVGIIALLLIPLVIPSSMIERINLGFTADISILIRLVAWYNAVQQIAQHPLFGIGMDVWKQWYAGAVPVDVLYAEHPHNLILNLWLEMGIFGLLSYLYIIWAVLRRYWKAFVRAKSDSFHSIILIGMVSLLFACLTDIFIQQYSVGLFFWITMGFLYSLSRNSAKTEE